MSRRAGPALSGKKALFAAAAILLLAAGCNSQTATNVQTTPVAQTPTGANSEHPPAVAPVGDTSNASLNASLTNVDSQMNSLNTDSADVDSSINEQQAP